MTDTELDAYVQRLVDAAPPLTADQKQRLAELFHPIRPLAATGMKRNFRTRSTLQFLPYFDTPETKHAVVSITV